MKAHALFLPSLALGGALLLVQPASEAGAFSLLGYNLSPGQRDFRVFNNLADASANNNTAQTSQFPGAVGAVLAFWKGGVEWGSRSHGDGSGDPTQTNLGDGGANFDAFYAGEATTIGGPSDNVISAIPACGGGVLAYTEGNGGNGWRIRFCDDITFADGPGSINFNQFDLQAVQCHEYGHALGLGHTSANGATMFPSISNGNVALRSINADDIAGVQQIYGLAAATKPIICGTSVSAGTITLSGSNFDPVDNDVWFCPSAVTPGGTGDPRVRVFGVASSNNGTQIAVAIPAAAGAGDVIVKTSATGGASVSNAFPTDLVNPFGVACPFAVASISPASLEPFDPGTAKSVTVSGVNLDDTLQVDLNGNAVAGSRWSIVNSTTINIDMPLGLLGANTLTLSDGDTSSSIPFTVVEPATPLLELGDGNPANVVMNGGTMSILVGGKVGTTHQIFYSGSNLPSSHPAVDFDIGNAFTNLLFGAVFTIGSEGYKQFNAPIVFGGGSPKVFYSQGVDVSTPPAPKFAVSNVQSVTLVP